MSYMSELDAEREMMAGGINMCSGACLSVMSTQNLQDLFKIFSAAAKTYGKDRDMQLGTLMAIRDELKKRDNK